MSSRKNIYITIPAYKIVARDSITIPAFKIVLQSSTNTATTNTTTPKTVPSSSKV